MKSELLPACCGSGALDGTLAAVATVGVSTLAPLAGCCGAVAETALFAALLAGAAAAGGLTAFGAGPAIAPCVFAGNGEYAGFGPQEEPLLHLYSN